MPDIRVSQLPELTNPTDDDILPIIDSPASGATTKKVTKANLLASTAPLVHTHTSAAAVSANTAVAANTAHAARTDNPHATTKAQVGLGSAENTADLANRSPPPHRPPSTAKQPSSTRTCRPT